LIADLIETLRPTTLPAPRGAHGDPSPREPLYGTLKGELPQPLQAYLDKKKIRLYSHQCEAIEHLRSGKNVVITTPTASGKRWPSTFLSSRPSSRTNPPRLFSCTPQRPSPMTS